MDVEPGTVLRHRNGSFVTISHRKNDNTGWWNTDGSGFADFVLVRADDWVKVCPTCHRPEENSDG